MTELMERAAAAVGGRVTARIPGAEDLAGGKSPRSGGGVAAAEACGSLLAQAAGAACGAVGRHERRREQCYSRVQGK